MRAVAFAAAAVDTFLKRRTRPQFHRYKGDMG
jgi:hypothetical protein